MQYTTLGKRTGLKTSVLGFGAMRLPMNGDRVDYDQATAMMHRAFEAGVNYVDSAVGYCNSDSQVAVGKALKGWRDKIIVSTKIKIRIRLRAVPSAPSTGEASGPSSYCTTATTSTRSVSRGWPS